MKLLLYVRCRPRSRKKWVLSKVLLLCSSSLFQITFLFSFYNVLQIWRVSGESLRFVSKSRFGLELLFVWFCRSSFDPMQVENVQGNVYILEEGAFGSHAENWSLYLNFLLLHFINSEWLNLELSPTSFDQEVVVSNYEKFASCYCTAFSSLMKRIPTLKLRWELRTLVVCQLWRLHFFLIIRYMFLF